MGARVAPPIAEMMLTTVKAVSAARRIPGSFMCAPSARCTHELVCKRVPMTDGRSIPGARNWDVDLSGVTRSVSYRY